VQPRDDFRAWLGDGDRQNAGRERTVAARRRLAGLSPVAAFLRTVDGLGEGDGDAIGAAIETLFADTVWVNMLVRDWIGEAMEDRFFVPPYRAASGDFHESALLLELPVVTISLCAIDPARLSARKREGAGKGSIFFPGNRTWLRFINAGGLRMSFWDAPDCADSVVTEAAPCVRTGVREIGPGELVAIDMARQSYLFDHAERPVLFLHAEMRVGGAVLAREYDAGSGGLVGQSSGLEIWSRIQMMVSYLGLSGASGAAAAFARIVAEAPFHIRWHVMREWLAFDPGSAMPALIEMAGNDPHHEVRAAARQTLALLECHSHSEDRAACRSS
jgi:hypothetical protein